MEYKRSQHLSEQNQKSKSKSKHKLKVQKSAYISSENIKGISPLKHGYSKSNLENVSKIQNKTIKYKDFK